MAKLPFSRVVEVTVTRQDRFPTRDGFGVPLILTSQAAAPVSAGTRTKVYGSMEEVAAEWNAADEAYKAALSAFSQNPRPKQLKIGFIDAGTLDTVPSPAMADELDAVYAADSDWYWLQFTAEFRDQSVLDAAVAWAEAKNIQLFLDSNDARLESAPVATPGPTDNIAVRNQTAYDRTSVFYHHEPEHYVAAAASGYTATRDFDQVDSAYTLKFKRLRGITPVNKASAAVQAITGFVPDKGLDKDEGHFANTYVDIGGLPMVVEGSTLSSAFIDEIHTSDWLIARTQETLLGILANNDVVPYTNTGIHMLVAGVEQVMQRAFKAGLIADVEDADSGDLLPAYEITVEAVEDVPAAQRRNRVAPDINCTFRYAGAVHYATVNYTMQF